MNISKKSVYVLLIMLMSVGLYTGCKKSSSDNNNPVSPVNTTPSLAGTWSLTKITVINQNNSQSTMTPQQAGVMIVWRFGSDSTASITVTDSTGTQTNQGTYSFSNNTLNLKSSQTGETAQFALTFTNNNVFTMPLQIEIEGTPANSILEFTKQQTGRSWE